MEWDNEDNNENQLTVAIDDVGDMLANFSPRPLLPISPENPMRRMLSTSLLGDEVEGIDRERPNMLESGLSSSNGGWRGKASARNGEWEMARERRSFFDTHASFYEDGYGASGGGWNGGWNGGGGGSSGGKRRGEEPEYNWNRSCGSAGWSEPTSPTTAQSFNSPSGISESDREDIRDAITAADAAFGKRSQCLFKAPLPVETLMHERDMGDLVFVDCRPIFSDRDRSTSGIDEGDVNGGDGGNDGGSGGGDYADKEDSAEEVDHRQPQQKKGPESGGVSCFKIDCSSSMMTNSVPIALVWTD